MAASDNAPNNVHLFTTQLAEMLLMLASATRGMSCQAIYLIGTSMGGTSLGDCHLHMKASPLSLSLPPSAPVLMLVFPSPLFTGAVAARFTELHASLVKKLVLVCPAGLHKDLPFVARMVRMPGVGEMLLSLASKNTIRKNAEKAYADPSHPGAAAHLDSTLARGDVLASQHPGKGSVCLELNLTVLTPSPLPRLSFLLRKNSRL